MRKIHKAAIALISAGICAAAIAAIALLIHNGIIWHLVPDKGMYPIEGIDVSNHQGSIRWDEIPRDIEFAYIKATEGDDFVDKRFAENAQGAKKRGLRVGAYHFFHFNYNGGAQARNFIRVVGDSTDLIPVVDIEFSGNPRTYDKNEVIKNIEECIDVLADYYRVEPIIYTTFDAYEQLIKDRFDNKIWIRSIVFPVDPHFRNMILWQYHDRAKIQGIDSIVDKNVFKGTREEFEALIMEE